MERKKFRQNLENTLGKKLDNLNKNFLTYRLDLEKARSQIREISKYIESKNSSKRHSIHSTPAGLEVRPKALSHTKSTAPTMPEEKKYKSDESSLKKPAVATAIQSLPNGKSQSLPEKPPVRISVTKRPKRKFEVKAHLDQILSQIKDIESHYPIENLKTKTVFTISLGAKSAFDIIKTMSKDNFIIGDCPNKKVVWAIGLLYQLLGENFDLELPASVKRAQEFFDLCLESNNMSDFLIDVVRHFDFSDENIDAIEEYIFGNDELLAPQSYTQVSQLCGLLMVALREAIIYCGFIKGKSPIWRIYQRLIYKKQVLEQN